jgi:hypothetical protein
VCRLLFMLARLTHVYPSSCFSPTSQLQNKSLSTSPNKRSCVATIFPSSDDSYVTASPFFVQNTNPLHRKDSRSELKVSDI